MIDIGFKADKLFPIHNSLAYDKQIEIRKSLNVSDVYHNHFGNTNYNLFFVGRLTPIKKLDQILEKANIYPSEERQRVYDILIEQMRKYKYLFK